MSLYNLCIINSIASLREKSEYWDDLWFRSSVVSPLAQAKFIAQWVEKFAPKGRFCALVVQSNNRFLAALPIVETKKAKVISAGMNPSNTWAMSGQFLVDFRENTERVINLLVSGFRNLPFSILWFDYIRCDEPEWILLKRVLSAQNMPSHWLVRYPSAVVNFDRTSGNFLSQFDAKGLSKIERKYRRYYLNNNIQFAYTCSREEVLPLLSSCFELENLGWKGGAKGGSILKRGMDSFVKDQALALSDNNEFFLFMLKNDDKLIAFLYGILSKKTLFMLKSSYDPAFCNYAPGQVLMYLIFNDFCQENDVLRVDFVGEAMAYQKLWNPIYSLNVQCVLPLSTCSGRFFYFLYNFFMPLKRKFKKIVTHVLKNINKVIL